MQNQTKQIGVALLAGVLFALGLVLSGMTQTTKVMGFLNIGGMFTGNFPGTWDPSLAFVMGGAVMVTLLAFAITPRIEKNETHNASSKPWFSEKFELPTRKDIDAKLLLGAALFGIGWGLAGYCPGPALASLFTAGADAMVFVLAMLAGMWVAKKLG